MAVRVLTVRLLCLWLALASQAEAADLTTTRFLHKDWELTCDNTRTCRAAGYQNEEEPDAPVSVLLTRKAGPGASVMAQLQLGSYEESSLPAGLPPVLKLSMNVNGRDLGQVAVAQNTLIGELSATQVEALIPALSKRDGSIVWHLGEHRWRLSGKGATAVLLKMDEFQGRIGTPGALIKKGQRTEASVPPPLPAPIVQAVRMPKPVEGDSPLSAGDLKALGVRLRADASDCVEEDEVDDAPERALSVTRLSGKKLLASTLCWRAAYNEGYAYWVINAKPPFQPKLVTSSGTTYSDGEIVAQQKGRGLGDCWAQETWTWNGEQFVHTASSTSGMCKLIAPGGAWTLPLLVTDVRPAR